MTQQFQRRRIMLCGPSRESVSGVATHLNQLFASSLGEKYFLSQFQVGSEGRCEGKLRKVIRYLTSPLMLAIAIIRSTPEIVHLNSSLEQKSYWRDLSYLVISKIFNRHVVFQVHGGVLPARFLGESSIGQAFLRWSLNLPDVIVLLAKIEQDAYTEFNTGKRTKVIPNAIDLNEYSNVNSKRFLNDKIKLGYIGRLAPDKGIKEAIEALSILKRRGFVGLQLIIAGSGPYEAELRRVVDRELVKESVEFIGPVFSDKKIKFWQDIDLFVFPTFHREGLPYTILEALASGTPAITTKVGGIPDVIQNGVQGALLDAHDAESVAQNIEKLLADPVRLRSMSKAAIKHANKKYSVDRLANQFDQLYRELLD